MANMNSVGASTGDVLAQASSIHMAGDLYFVSSVIGDASNTGLNRQDPFASIITALAAAGADDIIVLAADHAEVLSTNITISSQATIIGEGNVAGIPSPTITTNSQGIAITGDDVQIRNVQFLPPSSAQGSGDPATIGISGARASIIGCYFKADELVGNVTLELLTGAAQVLIQDTTFLSTATRQTVAADNAPPPRALEVAAAMNDLWLRGVVFDGGEIGWSDRAFKASAAAVTRLRGEQLSFLRGADYAIHASTTGYFSVTTRTGGVTGVW